MVFFHGGGWVIGDLDTHDPYCAEAARQLDMPVIAVDYRLAPEHPFPAAPEDCEAATRWVADQIPCTGLVLSGDSAGGNLAIATALTLRDKPASKPVIAIHPIYPAVTTHHDWQSYRDFKEGYLLTEGGMKWFGDQYAADPADYRAAPIDDRIMLFQRGNAPARDGLQPVDATTEISWRSLAAHLADPGNIAPPAIENVTRYEESEENT